jgi:hypothetical protein
MLTNHSAFEDGYLIVYKRGGCLSARVPVTSIDCIEVREEKEIAPHNSCLKVAPASAGGLVRAGTRAKACVTKTQSDSRFWEKF